MTLRLFLIILTFFLRPIADAQELHSFADVENYLQSHPEAKMEDTIARLSAELRSNYQLVYESRSTMKASLQKPRVILHNADQTKIISFGGDPLIPGGNRMEFMELNPSTRKLELKLVDFARKGTDRVIPNPKDCIECHASRGISLRKILRPIWDTYPDWPGVYGSSHNNYVMERGDKGVSGVQDLKFEADGFEKFKNSASADARYRHLIGLDKKTLPKMAEAGTLFSDRLIGLNNENTLAYIKEAIEEIKHNPSPELRLRKQEELEFILNEYSDPVRPKTSIHGKSNVFNELEKTFVPDLRNLNSRREAYYQSKLERLKRIIRSHSDASADIKIADALQIGEANFWSSRMPAIDLGRPGLPQLKLEKILESLNLDTGSSSIAFELFSAVEGPGNYYNLKFKNVATMLPLISDFLKSEISPACGTKKPVDTLRLLFNKNSQS